MSIQSLKLEISKCTLCADHLGHEPRPVFAFSPQSKIVMIGQAPGSIVHQTGKPWDDKSGSNLRVWMGVDHDTFYDDRQIAIVPMGFCYPGKGKSGDLPPRKECAPQWHNKVLETLVNAKLVMLIGKYAQDYYLGKQAKQNLTQTVMHFEDYLPRFFVLPHPSPRNNIWMKKNPWFRETVLPSLRKSVQNIL